MVALEFTLVLVAVIGLILMIDQYFIPLFRGQPTFPTFRKAGREARSLREELSELELEQDVARLTDELDARRAELNRRKTPRSA